MDRRLQKRLFDEVKGYMESSSTRLAEREMSHLASTYYDPDYLSREHALLRAQPIIVGHSSALPAAGDYIAHEDSGVPILLVRQSSGALKGFLNVCRHRGARVCAAGKGNKRSFTCPYHAWSYKSDGALAAAPRPGFPNIEVADNGLIELAVEERHGLIWMVLTPGVPIDVEAHLGVLDAELASYQLGDYVLERDTVIETRINWKFVLDGFLEVYHIPFLHPDSIAPWIYGRYSPFESIGRHSRLIGVRKSFDDVRELPFEESDFMKHIAVNYQIFPNSIAVWQGDHFEIWSSYPGSTPGECKVRVQSVVSKAMVGEKFQRRWDRNWKLLLDTVASEDWAISAEVQKSLPFVGNQRVLFGKNEPGLQHFHGILDSIVRGM